MKKFLFFAASTLCCLLLAVMPACKQQQLDIADGNASIAKSKIPISTSDVLIQHGPKAEFAIKVMDKALLELYPSIQEQIAHGNIGYDIEFYTRQTLEQIFPDYITGNEDTLMYVINFSDEKGYALLAYDFRVLAMSDKGNLYLSDFSMPIDENAYREETPKYIIRDLINKSLFNVNTVRITDYDSISEIFIPFVKDSYDMFSFDTVLSEKVGPSCPMKLDQTYPYNYFCPSIEGRPCYAGCVAIAIANIFSANTYPEFRGTFTWNNIITRWTDYAESHSTFSGISLNASHTENLPILELARRIHDIGIGVEMNYGISGSSASNLNARRFLANSGYNNVHERRANNVDYVYYMYHNTPLYISGYHRFADDNVIGHAWVLDGMVDFSIYIKRYIEGYEIDMPCVILNNLVHCNYGWAGHCDGYYEYSLFDLSSGPVTDDEYLDDLDIDDDNPPIDWEHGYRDLCFEDYLRIITYE